MQKTAPTIFLVDAWRSFYSKSSHFIRRDCGANNSLCQRQRIIVRHIGSSTEKELTALYREAETVREQLSFSTVSFFIIENPPNFYMKIIYN